MRGGGASEPLNSKDFKNRKSGFIKKFFAFTLAEVLITLGVIGVVAALTMPALISNHKKKVYVTQLKKSVNTLSNGFRQMLADENVDSLEYTALLEPSQSGGKFTLNPSVLPKYFNIVHQEDNFASYSLIYKSLRNVTTYGHQAGGFSPCSRITTADGAQLCIAQDLYGDGISVLIDVNGHNRLPNTVGLDVFAADFNLNGMLEIEGGSLSNTHETDACFGSQGYASGTDCLNNVIMHNWEITYY